MKKFPAVLCALLGIIAMNPAMATYAPIPPVEQGHVITVYVSAGSYYDTNIFGAAENSIGSWVYEVQPNAVFNFSVEDQTFFTANYQVTLDYFENRPGKKLLVSQSLGARLAHTFSPRVDCEISDTYQIIKNPESLLPGIGGLVVNPDQSYDYNLFNAKVSLNATKRTSFKAKVRAGNFFYDNRFLRNDLNHGDYTAGLEAVRSVRENLQATAEYRYEAVRYTDGGNLKNKDAHTFFVGADYAATKLTACTVRLGVEELVRKNGGNDTLPHVELGIKHDFRSDCYVSVGFVYEVAETSDVIAYTDMYSHHFFVNAQYGITRQLAVSGLVDWMPSRLNGREHVASSIDETNSKLGGALTYTGGKHWSVSLTCDYDDVHSDDPQRNLKRVRTGIHARIIF